MTSQQELTPDAAAAIQKVEKLMRLAGKNPNEHEAAAAMAKAMEILAAYNLDLSIIEQGGGEKSKRSDEKMTGGLYHYQRELWEAVAELNFCLYWHQQTWDKDKKARRKDKWNGGTYIKTGGYRFEHRVVGRQVNVIGTRNMAQYLEATIERLTRERLNGDGTQFFTRWAISFREGMAAAVVEKIEAERAKFLAEEKKKARAAERAAQNAASAGASTSTALTVASLAQSEEDANQDFLHGEGYSARKRERERKWAEERQKEREEYAKWAKANPEEAAKKAEEARKRYRSSWNAGTGESAREKRMDWGAFRGGREVGRNISIHQQAEGGKSSKRLK